MQHIQKWIADHNEHPVYSFDVFDTLLRRRVDPPETVKRLVAERIAVTLGLYGSSLSPQDILRQRNEVEAELRQAAASRGDDSQCYLDDVIANTLKAIHAESLISTKEIVDYELYLERTATESMPGVRDVLAYCHEHGKRVIAVSETYLSATQLEAILEHHNLLRYIDKIYASSDAARSKVSGKLFEHIVHNEGENLVHVGDNCLLDFIIPCDLGIKALWFHSRTERTRKHRLAKLAKGKNKLNYVNAVVRTGGEQKGELYEFGYRVLGPPLTVFVHNVAEQAKEDGVQRLFFVARDGFAFKKIYAILRNTICTAPDFPPAAYVCLGRAPVRLASVDASLRGFIDDPHVWASPNIATILRSYGLSPDDFIQMAEKHGIEADSANPSPRTGLSRLIEDSEFRQMVHKKATGCQLLLERYLRDIGFFGLERIAVVDSNAEGITQLLVDKVFSEVKDYPHVMRYYFNALNLNPGMNPTTDLPHVRGFVSDWRRDTRAQRIPPANFGFFLEIFTQPNHGTTIGYRNVNGRVLPVFRDSTINTQYQMTSQVMKGILGYANDYCTYYDLHGHSCTELLEGAKTNIRRWMLSPPRDDALLMDGVFFSIDWPWQGKANLVADISMSDILTVRGLVRKLTSCTWHQGSLALAPLPGLVPMYNLVAAVWNSRPGRYPLQRQRMQVARKTL